MNHERQYELMAANNQASIPPELLDSDSRLFDRLDWARGMVIEAHKQEPPQISDDLETLLDRLSSAVIGLVCVRPEMYHEESKVTDYLLAQGLQIAMSFSTQLNLQQYSRLYEYSIFKILNDKFSLGPKGIETTAGPMEILLVRPSSDMDREDFLYDLHRLKGKAGVRSNDNLRGSLVLETAKELKIALMNDPLVRAALDPLGFYTSVANGSIKDLIDQKYWVRMKGVPRDQIALQYFTGVHIAHFKEVDYHLRTILSCAEFDIEELASLA